MNALTIDLRLAQKMKFLSHFRKSDIQIFQEQRSKYLRNLAWQLSLGYSEEASISYATRVTGFNYKFIEGLEEWDFLALYERFRDFWLIPDSFSESVRLSRFKGPIMKGRTPDEIYGYATGKYDGDPNLPWRELYYATEISRVDYLNEFARLYSNSFNLFDSKLKATITSSYQFVINDNPIYQICDFSVVYNQLIANRVEFARAVSIGHALTGITHWHEFGLPDIVRQEGRQVVKDIETYGISLRHP